MRALLIGDAARRSGIKVPTIRYYEGIGLLPPPPRLANNRRIYDEAAVTRLSFIRHARLLGFTVLEIRALLGLRDQPASSCAEADAIAKRKLSDVDTRIRELRALRKEISRMIDRCSQRNAAHCTVLSGLASFAQ